MWKNLFSRNSKSKPSLESNEIQSRDEGAPVVEPKRPKPVACRTGQSNDDRVSVKRNPQFRQNLNSNQRHDVGSSGSSNGLAPCYLPRPVSSQYSTLGSCGPMSSSAGSAFRASTSLIGGNDSYLGNLPLPPRDAGVSLGHVQCTTVNRHHMMQTVSSAFPLVENELQHPAPPVEAHHGPGRPNRIQHLESAPGCQGTKVERCESLPFPYPYELCRIRPRSMQGGPADFSHVACRMVSGSPPSQYNNAIARQTSSMNASSAAAHSTTMAPDTCCLRSVPTKTESGTFFAQWDDVSKNQRNAVETLANPSFQQHLSSPSLKAMAAPAHMCQAALQSQIAGGPVIHSSEPNGTPSDETYSSPPADHPYAVFLQQQKAQQKAQRSRLQNISGGANDAFNEIGLRMTTGTFPDGRSATVAPSHRRIRTSALHYWSPRTQEEPGQQDRNTNAPQFALNHHDVQHLLAAARRALDRRPNAHVPQSPVESVDYEQLFCPSSVKAPDAAVTGATVAARNAATATAMSTTTGQTNIVLSTQQASSNQISSLSVEGKNALGGDSSNASINLSQAVLPKSLYPGPTLVDKARRQIEHKSVPEAQAFTKRAELNSQLNNRALHQQTAPRDKQLLPSVGKAKSVAFIRDAYGRKNSVSGVPASPEFKARAPVLHSSALGPQNPFSVIDPRQPPLRKREAYTLLNHSSVGVPSPALSFKDPSHSPATVPALADVFGVAGDLNQNRSVFHNAAIKGASGARQVPHQSRSDTDKQMQIGTADSTGALTLDSSRSRVPQVSARVSRVADSSEPKGSPFFLNRSQNRPPNLQGVPLCRPLQSTPNVFVIEACPIPCGLLPPIIPTRSSIVLPTEAVAVSPADDEKMDTTYRRRNSECFNPSATGPAINPVTTPAEGSIDNREKKPVIDPAIGGRLHGAKKIPIAPAVRCGHLEHDSAAGKLRRRRKISTPSEVAYSKNVAGPLSREASFPVCHRSNSPLQYTSGTGSCRTLNSRTIAADPFVDRSLALRHVCSAGDGTPLAHQAHVPAYPATMTVPANSAAIMVQGLPSMKPVRRRKLQGHSGDRISHRHFEPDFQGSVESRPSYPVDTTRNTAERAEGASSWGKLKLNDPEFARGPRRRRKQRVEPRNEPYTVMSSDNLALNMRPTVVAGSTLSDASSETLALPPPARTRTTQHGKADKVLKPRSQQGVSAELAPGRRLRTLTGTKSKKEARCPSSLCGLRTLTKTFREAEVTLKSPERKSEANQVEANTSSESNAEAQTLSSIAERTKLKHPPHLSECRRAATSNKVAAADADPAQKVRSSTSTFPVKEGIFLDSQTNLLHKKVQSLNFSESGFLSSSQEPESSLYQRFGSSGLMDLNATAAALENELFEEDDPTWDFSLDKFGVTLIGAQRESDYMPTPVSTGADVTKNEASLSLLDSNCALFSRKADLNPDNCQEPNVTSSSELQGGLRIAKSASPQQQVGEPRINYNERVRNSTGARSESVARKQGRLTCSRKSDPCNRSSPPINKRAVTKPAQRSENRKVAVTTVPTRELPTRNGLVDTTVTLSKDRTNRKNPPPKHPTSSITSPIAARFRHATAKCDNGKFPVRGNSSAGGKVPYKETEILNDRTRSAIIKCEDIVATEAGGLSKAAAAATLSGVSHAKPSLRLKAKKVSSPSKLKMMQERRKHMNNVKPHDGATDDGTTATQSSLSQQISCTITMSEAMKLPTKAQPKETDHETAAIGQLTSRGSTGSFLATSLSCEPASVEVAEPSADESLTAADATPEALAALTVISKNAMEDQRCWDDAVPPGLSVSQGTCENDFLITRTRGPRTNSDNNLYELSLSVTSLEPVMLDQDCSADGDTEPYHEPSAFPIKGVEPPPMTDCVSTQLSAVWESMSGTQISSSGPVSGSEEPCQQISSVQQDLHSFPVAAITTKQSELAPYGEGCSTVPTSEESESQVLNNCRSTDSSASTAQRPVRSLPESHEAEIMNFEQGCKETFSEDNTVRDSKSSLGISSALLEGNCDNGIIPQLDQEQGRTSSSFDIESLPPSPSVIDVRQSSDCSISESGPASGIVPKQHTELQEKATARDFSTGETAVLETNHEGKPLAEKPQFDCRSSEGDIVVELFSDHADDERIAPQDVHPVPESSFDYSKQQNESFAVSVNNSMDHKRSEDSIRSFGSAESSESFPVLLTEQGLDDSAFEEDKGKVSSSVPLTSGGTTAAEIPEEKTRVAVAETLEKTALDTVEILENATVIAAKTSKEVTVITAEIPEKIIGEISEEATVVTAEASEETTVATAGTMEEKITVTTAESPEEKITVALAERSEEATAPSVFATADTSFFEEPSYEEYLEPSQEEVEPLQPLSVEELRLSLTSALNSLDLKIPNLDRPLVQYPRASLIAKRDKEMRKVRYFGWEYASPGLKSLQGCLSRFTIEQRSDHGVSNLADLDGNRLVVQSQLLSQINNGLQSRQVFLYYYGRPNFLRAAVEPFATRLHRFVYTRRIQNTVRRLQEWMLLHGGSIQLRLPPNLLKDDDRNSLSSGVESQEELIREIIILPEYDVLRRQVLGTLFDLISEQIYKDTAQPPLPGTPGSEGLELNVLSQALSAFSLWPRETSQEDRCEAILAIVAGANPELASFTLIKGQQQDSHPFYPGYCFITAEMFINSLASVPYNLPDFPPPDNSISPDVLLEGAEQSVGFARGVPETEAALIMDVALAICHVITETVLVTPLTERCRRSYIESELAMWMKRQGIPEECWHTCGIGLTETQQWLLENNIGYPPVFFSEQDMLLSRILSMEEVQSLLIPLWAQNRASEDITFPLDGFRKDPVRKALHDVKFIHRAASIIVGTALACLSDRVDLLASPFSAGLPSLTDLIQAISARFERNGIEESIRMPLELRGDDAECAKVTSNFSTAKIIAASCCYARNDHQESPSCQVVCCCNHSENGQLETQSLEIDWLSTPLKTAIEDDALESSLSPEKADAGNPTARTQVPTVTSWLKKPITDQKEAQHLPNDPNQFLQILVESGSLGIKNLWTLHTKDAEPSFRECVTTDPSGLLPIDLIPFQTACRIFQLAVSSSNVFEFAMQLPSSVH